ncbi:MAG: MarR family winged helix-turn-helix transcriptional regulator [Dermatophilaceae bacterium]|nr:MarR family transcriptional regulator [Intrasporangiaceae bacterium]
MSSEPTPAITPQHPGPSHLATDLRLACLRIARRNRFESVVAVAPHQFAALSRIGCGPATVGELAEWERVSAPAMSRTVSALADAGWIDRSGDPADGRRVILTITDAGRQLLAETRRARDEWMTVRLGRLSPDEIERLEAALPLLERIATS